jgi:hypothetical protein
MAQLEHLTHCPGCKRIRVSYRVYRCPNCGHIGCSNNAELFWNGCWTAMDCPKCKVGPVKRPYAKIVEKR